VQIDSPARYAASAWSARLLLQAVRMVLATMAISTKALTQGAAMNAA